MIKLKLELSRGKNIPCLWEDHSPKEMLLVGDKESRPKRAIYTPKSGHLKHGRVALIPVKAGDLIFRIGYSRYRGLCETRVDRITSLDVKSGEVHTEEVCKMKTAEVKPLVVKLRFEDISKEMVPFIWGSSFEYPGRGVNKELLRPTTDRKPEFPMWGPRALYISNFHEMYKDDGRLYPDEVYTDLSGLTTHEILAFRDKISIESSVLYHPSYARKGA